jgi:hypothetical protein
MRSASPYTSRFSSVMPVMMSCFQADVSHVTSVLYVADVQILIVRSDSSDSATMAFLNTCQRAKEQLSRHIHSRQTNKRDEPCTPVSGYGSINILYYSPRPSLVMVRLVDARL